MDHTVSHNVEQKVSSVKFSLPERALAHLFSIVFHPLFIPTMAVAYLVYLQPGYFLGVSSGEKERIIIRVAVNTIFFPGLTVLLLKGLGFIKSIFLRTQKERIIPYVAANIFYFWVFLVFKNQGDMPPIATSFLLGIFLSSSLGLIVNSYFKISMHALGMGSFAGLMLMIIYSGFPFGTFLPFMVILFLAGIVCTSRLMVSNHTPFDIYSGFIIGILCQAIGYLFFAA